MSDKVRVHEIAKELGIASKEVVDKANAMGMSLKTASSSVSMEEAEKIMNYIMNPDIEEPKPKKVTVKKTASKESVSETVSRTEKQESEVKTSVEPVNDAPEVKAMEPAVTKEKVSEETPVQAELPKVAEAAPKKRSGLRIVKKKKPKVHEDFNVPKIEDAAAVSSYGKMSQEVLKELASKKAKKRSNAPAQRKESGKTINIFAGSMADVSMDYDDNEVVLLDLNEIDKKPIEEEVRKPRPKKPAGRNAGKKQGGNRKPRQVSRDKRKKYVKDKPVDEVVTHVEIPEDIRVYEFAEKLNRPMTDIIKVLFNLGMMATKNDFLGKDEIEILSEEFDVEVTVVDPKDAFNYEESYAQSADDTQAEERPPVITIMGHVHHGKTSLLDAIRHARIADGEAGGITQHIGAYTIDHNGKQITFIDTPGHAAFSHMRERGAQVTDIIIIVVAADDGVKPQTLEVIKLAKESGAPVIIALNKMDKEGANPDVVKGQMAEHGMTPVDWGGDTEFIPLSAKTGEGIEDLLENILVQAEILELRANPNVLAKSVVVESSL